MPSTSSVASRVGGGGTVNASVTVNVDARGAGPDQAQALAHTIAAAVERRVTAKIIPTVREGISRGAL